MVQQRQRNTTEQSHRPLTSMEEIISSAETITDSRTSRGMNMMDVKIAEAEECTVFRKAASTVTVCGEAKLDSKVVLLSAESPSDLSVGHAVRTDAMLEFESKRRSVYHNNLEALRLRWRSSLSVLQEGLHETQRLERLILGFARANQVYASTLESMYGDTFDLLDSSPVTDDTDGASCPDYVSSHAENVSSVGVRRDGIFSSLTQSQSSVAEQFTEDAEVVSMGIGQDVTALRKELETNINEVEQLANAVLAELDYIEEQVSEAWNIYDPVAYKTSHTEVNMPLLTPQKKTASSTSMANPALAVSDTPKDCVSMPVSSPNSVACFGNDSPQESSNIPFRGSLASAMSKETFAVSFLSPISAASSGRSSCESSAVVLPNIKSGIAGGSDESSPIVSPTSEQFGVASDSWLAEMRYRVLVAYQASAWEKAQPWALVESVISMELKRRKLSHEFLLAFVPRQRRLFSRATSSQTQVLDDMMRPTQEEIKLEIEAAVEKHVDALQEGSSRSNGDNAFEMDMETLDTPLSSNLVCSSTIMERKRGWKGWIRVLAVVTADRFLHLFDVPSCETTQSPEEIFLALVPMHKFPTSDGGIPQAKPRNHFQNANPTQSFFLPKYTLTINPRNGREIEMVGRVVGRFGQSKTRTILLRTGSVKKASEWLGSLKMKASPVAENWDDVKVGEESAPFLQNGTESESSSTLALSISSKSVGSSTGREINVPYAEHFQFAVKFDTSLANEINEEDLGFLSDDNSILSELEHLHDYEEQLRDELEAAPQESFHQDEQHQMIHNDKDVADDGSTSEQGPSNDHSDMNQTPTTASVWESASSAFESTRKEMEWCVDGVMTVVFEEEC